MPKDDDFLNKVRKIQEMDAYAKSREASLQRLSHRDQIDKAESDREYNKKFEEVKNLKKSFLNIKGYETLQALLCDMNEMSQKLCELWKMKRTQIVKDVLSLTNAGEKAESLVHQLVTELRVKLDRNVIKPEDLVVPSILQCVELDKTDNKLKVSALSLSSGQEFTDELKADFRKHVEEWLEEHGYVPGDAPPDDECFFKNGAALDSKTFLALRDDPNNGLMPYLNKKLDMEIIQAPSPRP